MEQDKRSFWTTLPGILTAIAALITALGGVVGVRAIADTGTTRSTSVPATMLADGRSSSDQSATAASAGMEVMPRDDQTAVPLDSSTTTTSTSTTKPPVMTKAFLRADPVTYSGACPATITFSGRISFLGSSGTLAYRFERSDGANAPVRSLTFTAPGSTSVSDTWQLGAAGVKFSGWETLVILQPQSLRSDQASFSITCI